VSTVMPNDPGFKWLNASSRPRRNTGPGRLPHDEPHAPRPPLTDDTEATSPNSPSSITFGVRDNAPALPFVQLPKFNQVRLVRLSRRGALMGFTTSETKCRLHPSHRGYFSVFKTSTIQLIKTPAATPPANSSQSAHTTPPALQAASPKQAERRNPSSPACTITSSPLSKTQ